MPSPTRHASPSRRPFFPRTAPSLSSLVTLDLSKPGERRAHDFLCYATDQRDPMLGHGSIGGRDVLSGRVGSR